jgi:hypothetical protein
LIPKIFHLGQITKQGPEKDSVSDSLTKDKVEVIMSDILCQVLNVQNTGRISWCVILQNNIIFEVDSAVSKQLMT